MVPNRTAPYRLPVFCGLALICAGLTIVLLIMSCCGCASHHTREVDADADHPHLIPARHALRDARRMYIYPIERRASA